MHKPYALIQTAGCLIACLALVGCEKTAPQTKPAEPAKPAAPHASEPAKPVEPAKPAAPQTPDPAKPDAAAKPAAAAAPAGGAELKLAGIVFAVPEGWVRAPADPGSMGMGPVAVFTMPKAEGDAADCAVRITHYPSMKGKDDSNIDRWLGMVGQADGKPHTRDTAKVVTTTTGNVRFTVLDMPGTVFAGMGGPEADIPNARMIAAIVDHPAGPHYVKVYGAAKSMEKWAAGVDAFLKSAKTTE